MNKRISVVRATTDSELRRVQDLMREYLEWHHSRYDAFRDLIEQYFDHAGYQRELEGLPGDYAAPTGRLLIACRDDEALGCVALRDLGGGIAEMKRMFVTSQAQGLGIGRLLATRIMATARDLGYRTMRLDTGWLQTEAVTMYRKLGFRNIGPYYDAPPELQRMLVFMESDLVDERKAC